MHGSEHRWLTLRPVLSCPCCGDGLVELDAVQQAAKRLPRFPFWRRDTRRIMVRCEGCKHFHMVFAYPIFNCIPPARLTVEMTLLNMLIAAMLMCTALQHGRALALLSL